MCKGRMEMYEAGMWQPGMHEARLFGQLISSGCNQGQFRTPLL